MAYKLTSLPKTQFSGLDFDNILEDITNLIKENPKYNEEWDDFLSSNAGRMMTELFAYIGDQLATRIDWIVNEHYVGTATQKRSVMRMLKVIGYKFKLPIASSVNINISFDVAFGVFDVTKAFNPNDDNTNFNPYTLYVKDKSGNSKTFECVNYNENTNKYDFLSSIILNTGSQTNQNLFHVNRFYEGKTFVETFVGTTDNNPLFELSNKSIIEGSISVFIVQESAESEIVEAVLVDSFLDPEAQKAVDDFGNSINIPYIINVLDKDKASIEFAPTSLLPNINRRLEEGNKVRVIYRVGGGKEGNITKQAINETKTYSTIVDGNAKVVNIVFKNPNEGTGGEDSETIEHAAAYAPLSIRTVDKAVTENDYDILLNSHNTILKAKTYGNNNMPEDIFEKYKMFIKPLEVWNYILKLKPGWENIKPSEYNDFQWMTLRKENRFNEEWFFSNGEFNVSKNINYDTLNETLSVDIDGNGVKTFFNAIYVNTSFELKDYTANQDLKIKFSTEKVLDNHFYNIAKINFFDETKTNNEGLIDNNVKRLYSPISSELVSSQNINNGITLSQNFNLNIDSYSLTTPVNLTGTSLTALTIANMINTEVTSQIASGVASAKGYQTLTFSDSPLITDSTDLTKQDYYFYINDEEFKITTNINTTYSELVDHINDSFKINESIGKVSYGSYDITNIKNINLLEKGYKLTIDDEIYDNSSLSILDIFQGENRIRVANLGTHTDEVNLTFYKYLCYYDEVNFQIKIYNNKETPHEAVILRAGKTGDDLLTNINVGNTTLDAPLLGGNVKGSFNFGLNVDLTTDPSIADGEYFFNINNYDYSITVASDVSSYNDVIAKIDAAISPNFECVGLSNDIVINSIAYNYVELKSGINTSDLIYVLHSGEFIFLNEGKGGGDYSSIISVYYGKTGEEYLRVLSPSKGYVSSKIELTNVNSLFGETRINKLFRGIKAINLITNGSDIGKFIFEYGKIDSPEIFKNVFLNYIQEKSSVIEIGKYFYNKYDQYDPKWRSIADRLYNTVYDNLNQIDYFKSKFEIKFTKEPTTERSIFSITSDWDLKQSSPAFVESQDTSNISDLNTEYYIKIGLDDKTPVEIDLTGNGGVTVNPSPDVMIGLINTALNDTYLTTEVKYAFIDEVSNKIVINSSSYKNGSRVIIYKPTNNDATTKFFNLPLLLNNETYIYEVNGDYYLDYTAETVVNGNLTGTEEGRNYLKLIPIDISTKVPDLKFYVSFIFDQTIVPNIYDGVATEISTAGEEYTVGSKYGDLDEDIYSSYLELKKIVGINNVFKETNFRTFDIVGTISYNSLYSKTQLQEVIENKLFEEFNLKNRDYSSIVSRSIIMKLIQETDGVNFAKIDYLGFDQARRIDFPDQKDVIECDFDEIIILSEKRYSFGSLIHGPIFNYEKG